ncbi:MAG: phytanoyl-CoA dioxygenase family protein [Saprospiraceae bacterium]|nr:phytanoyl-CoA dioxygenase family protein [Saprospiraceae bacterium]
MDWKAAMHANVDQLTGAEQEFLRTEGYLNLGPILTPSEVQHINNRIVELEEEEGEDAGSELADSKYIRHPKEAGADRLADLVNKGSVFDIFYTQPRVLAGISLVLGVDMKLSSLNYRAAKPGMGLQKLHVDWRDGKHYGQFRVCNSIWLLDDFTADNGATRVVPGSHLWDQMPEHEMADPLQPHPEEILIQGRAGSVFIFNSHVWHGGTTNSTALPRRSIHSYFCRRDQPQQVDQKRYITSETRNRIGASACHLLDV